MPNRDSDAAVEYMDCGCEMVRCENPDCRRPIYAPDGVCRACALSVTDARYERQLDNQIKENSMVTEITDSMVEAACVGAEGDDYARTNASLWWTMLSALRGVFPDAVDATTVEGADRARDRH